MMRSLKLALAVLLLAACGSWQGSGTVVKKEHRDAWVQTTIQCHPVNKTSVCVPNTIYWPEKWKVQVKDTEGKKHWVDVPSTAWDTYHIGDEYRA